LWASTVWSARSTTGRRLQRRLVTTATRLRRDCDATVARLPCDILFNRTEVAQESRDGQIDVASQLKNKTII